MDTIFIINKIFVERDFIKSKINEIAKKSKFKYFSHYEIGISIGDFGDRLTFGGMFKEYFDETLENKNFIEGYGCIMTCHFESDENILMPFLKLFVAAFPDFIVYDDTIGGTEDEPHLYTKAHIEKFNGADYMELFKNPPEDIGDIV